MSNSIDYKQEIDRRLIIYNYYQSCSYNSAIDIRENIKEKLASLDESFVGLDLFNIPKDNEELVDAILNKELIKVVKKYNTDYFGMNNLECYYIDNANSVTPDIVIFTEDNIYSFLSYVVSIDRYDDIFDFLNKINLKAIVDSLNIPSYNMDMITDGYRDIEIVFNTLIRVSKFDDIDYVKMFFKNFFIRNPRVITIDQLLNNIKNSNGNKALDGFRCTHFDDSFSKEKYYIYPY